MTVKVENIDLTGLVFGRAASEIAKKLLTGVTINAYNVEKLVVTGSEQNILTKFGQGLNFQGKGNPEKGPKYRRLPDAVFRRAVKNMLPHNKTRGTDAFKLLNVQIGNEENIKLTTYDCAKPNSGTKVMTLGDIAKNLGAKW